MSVTTLLIIITLLAPVRTVSPDATKNRKSQVSRQTKAKRTTSSGRVNTKRTQRQRHNQRYGTQRRTGNQIRRRNSRATTYTNKQVNKRSTNRVRKTQDLHSHIPSTQLEGKSSKGKTTLRSPAHFTPLQREILRLQMGVLLRDPEMGYIYRQIIRNRKNKK
jgi:hypothetical protein